MTLQDVRAHEVIDGLAPELAYAVALRGVNCQVVSPFGQSTLETRRWVADTDDHDEPLLDRCRGATLDIGCGPGRMTKALMARGVTALGIDVVPEAIRQARDRGGIALNRDVFDDLPGEGRWETALLADGNIGIGGDPVRLLRRVWRLLSECGRVLVDLAPPGGPIRVHDICLQVGGIRTRPFPWSVVPADQIELLAEAAAFSVLEVLEINGRWFAQLMKNGPAR